MEYKIDDANGKNERIGEIVDFIKVNRTGELFSVMHKHNLHLYQMNNITEVRDRTSRLLGSLHSEIASIQVLSNNLKELIHFFTFCDGLSDLIEPSDIDLLLFFSKSKYFFETKVKKNVDKLIIVLLFIPNFTQTLIELGILNEITSNFLNDSFLDELAVLCSLKNQIRDTVFAMGIPQQLAKSASPVNNVFPNISYVLTAKFAAALCAYPIENEEHMNTVHALFIILRRRIEKAPIDVEGAILMAMIKYAVFNDACFTSFTQFGLFNYLSFLEDSCHQANWLYLSKLLLAVVEYNPDYAKHLVENEHAWNLVLQIFIKNETNSFEFVYTQHMEHMLEAATIMTFVDVDRFVNIFEILLSKYEICSYQMKSKIGSIFYAALLNATYPQLNIFFNASLFLDILFENFPDPEIKWFPFLAQGLLNLLNYVESAGIDPTCFVAEKIFSTDFFEPWITKCETTKSEQDQNPLQSKMCDILITTFSSFAQKMMEKEE